jgi:shikimate kinase
MTVFLIGFMGAGKTHWASKLSETLNVPWTDLDELIEKKAGSTIAEIFRDKGESYFRVLEAECLRSLKPIEISSAQPEIALHKISAIVATGGGAPCFHDNMRWMNENGFTVWLNPTVAEIAERLKKGMEVRPLLKNLTEDGLTEFIAAKLKEREDFYNKAKLEIKNTNIAVAAFVNLILHA